MPPDKFTSSCPNGDEMQPEILQPMPIPTWLSTEAPIPPTLLDYFAAKAMQGFSDDDAYLHEKAELAYAIAEAMIAEREKRNA